MEVTSDVLDRGFAERGFRHAVLRLERRGRGFYYAQLSCLGFGARGRMRDAPLWANAMVTVAPHGPAYVVTVAKFEDLEGVAFVWRP